MPSILVSARLNVSGCTLESFAGQHGPVTFTWLAAAIRGR